MRGGFEMNENDNYYLGENICPATREFDLDGLTNQDISKIRIFLCFIETPVN